MPGALPNLLIIGASKCATTSLHAYLGQHPEVFMSRRKELQLFTRDDWRERVDWYRAQFRTDAAVRGESSPVYSMHPVFPGVPERVHELLPQAKLIYLVRDPIERLLAHYVELHSLHMEHRPLSEALADPEDPANPYVASSRYETQLAQYLRWFPEDRMLVVDQDDLRSRRRDTLRQVFEFVGVDAGLAAAGPELALNPRRDKRRLTPVGDWLLRRGALRPVPSLPGALKRGVVRVLSRRLEAPVLEEGTRAALMRVLRPEAERLRERTGKPFAGWSV